MLLLAIDTCDSRGSVAVFRNSQVLAGEKHARQEDYSSWLLPAVDRVLASGGVTHADLRGYAVASGPGSFTGVRVGLTSVKAWAEAFGKPIAPVSRLEAIASASTVASDFVASFVDAQRGQLFGGLYLRGKESLERIEVEMVAPPAVFLEWVIRHAKGKRVAWASLDPEILTELRDWASRVAAGEFVESVSSNLAPRIGQLGLVQLSNGRGIDALALDANYVRRSDAELFWKKSATP